MAKISGVVEEVMNSQSLALRPNSFGSGQVITRLAYDKGETPDQLRGEQISKGDCKGKTGTVVYEGKEIPATAACVARKYSN
jgi:hypothetical protein